jgi:hypothetical protein
LNFLNISILKRVSEPYCLPYTSFYIYSEISDKDLFHLPVNLELYENEIGETDVIANFQYKIS